VLVGAVVVVLRISTFSGVKLQEALSGRPAQESVTDIGAVNKEVNSIEGETVTVAVPDWPGVRIRVFAAVVAGMKFERATVNSHCVATLAATGDEVEVR
jgi:hypothetical protein